jgi:hypothetical protein
MAVTPGHPCSQAGVRASRPGTPLFTPDCSLTCLSRTLTSGPQHPVIAGCGLAGTSADLCNQLSQLIIVQCTLRPCTSAAKKQLPQRLAACIPLLFTAGIPAVTQRPVSVYICTNPVACTHPSPINDIDAGICTLAIMACRHSLT